MQIPQMESLSRAERVLRARTVEVLIAFVAGALRRHFRCMVRPKNLFNVHQIQFTVFRQIWSKLSAF